ncbi:MAG: hypothetical protein JWO98_4884 [Frankiales bacterium]|nr:hypothetical protein [Frankiales bacterium]
MSDPHQPAMSPATGEDDVGRRAAPAVSRALGIGTEQQRF